MNFFEVLLGQQELKLHPFGVEINSYPASGPAVQM